MAPARLLRPFSSRAARGPLASLLALGALAALLAGCPKRIGDSCRTNQECAYTNDRLCDLTQFEGYCTVAECVANACPDQSICVEFEAHTPRLLRRYCMNPCEHDTDCRAGYICQAPTVGPTEACPPPDLSTGAPPPACTRIVDSTPRLPRYCVQAP